MHIRKTSKKIVTLQCNSQRVALQMDYKPIFKLSASPIVTNWGYLENWKSTASV